jgi:hypothetical protein
MSIFSDSEIEEIEGLLDDVHGTFAREITYYQTKTQTILTNNPNHNFLFQGSPQNTTTEKIEVTGTINARILHSKKYDLNSIDYKNSNLDDVLLKDGEIRLKVNSAGNEILKKTKRIVVDEILCEISTDGRPIGPFSKKYFSYILKPIN